MFFLKQPEDEKKQYITLLQITGALSRLFSESPSPYLYYRIAETVFCRAFNARDLSRSDVAVDAEKDKTGIGLKTFLFRTGNSLEKVAEFNKDRNLYSDVSDSAEIVRIIADLRNRRMQYAFNLFQLNEALYHWVARIPDFFLIHEENMDLIDIKKIKSIQRKNNTIKFEDGKHEYSFNLSKSTLFKRFKTDKSDSLIIPVKIIEDPFEVLKGLITPEECKEILKVSEKAAGDSIILPLYSRKPTGLYVLEKSGLNQWNANGRKRHKDELYIPVPRWLYRAFPGFLPDRNKIFKLELPNGSILSGKICQDNGKALMSNPNKELGHWLLREVMEIPEGKLVTYDMLQATGIDSVELTKISEDHFRLDFKTTGTYEDFVEQYGM
jgi:hypothetical protein